MDTAALYSLLVVVLMLHLWIQYRVAKYDVKLKESESDFRAAVLKGLDSLVQAQAAHTLEVAMRAAAPAAPSTEPAPMQLVPSRYDTEARAVLLAEHAAQSAETLPGLEGLTAKDRNRRKLLYAIDVFKKLDIDDNGKRDFSDAQAKVFIEVAVRRIKET